MTDTLSPPLPKGAKPIASSSTLPPLPQGAKAITPPPMPPMPPMPPLPAGAKPLKTQTVDSTESPVLPPPPPPSVAGGNTSGQALSGAAAMAPAARPAMSLREAIMRNEYARRQQQQQAQQDAQARQQQQEQIDAAKQPKLPKEDLAIQNKVDPQAQQQMADAPEGVQTKQRLAAQLKYQPKVRPPLPRPQPKSDANGAEVADPKAMHEHEASTHQWNVTVGLEMQRREAIRQGNADQAEQIQGYMQAMEREAAGQIVLPSELPPLEMQGQAVSDARIAQRKHRDELLKTITGQNDDRRALGLLLNDEDTIANLLQTPAGQRIRQWAQELIPGNNQSIIDAGGMSAFAMNISPDKTKLETEALEQRLNTSLFSTLRDHDRLDLLPPEMLEAIERQRPLLEKRSDEAWDQIRDTAEASLQKHGRTGQAEMDAIFRYIAAQQVRWQLDPIGAGETLEEEWSKRGIKDKATLGIQKALDFNTIQNLMSDVIEGRASAGDTTRLALELERFAKQSAPRTFWGGVWKIASQLPEFAVAFGASGRASRTLAAGTMSEQGLLKGTLKYLDDFVVQDGVRRFLHPAMIPMHLRGGFEKAVGMSMEEINTLDDQQQSAVGALTSVLWHNFAEIVGESSGEFIIGPVWNKFSKATRINKAMDWLKAKYLAKPGKTQKMLQDTLRQFGYHGIVTEVFEERITGGLQGEGVLVTPEQFFQELVAFGILPTATGVAAITTDKAIDGQVRRAAKQEADAVRQTLTILREAGLEDVTRRQLMEGINAPTPGETADASSTQEATPDVQTQTIDEAADQAGGEADPSVRETDDPQGSADRGQRPGDGSAGSVLTDEARTALTDMGYEQEQIDAMTRDQQTVALNQIGFAGEAHRIGEAGGTMASDDAAQPASTTASQPAQPGDAAADAAAKAIPAASESQQPDDADRSVAEQGDESKQTGRQARQKRLEAALGRYQADVAREAGDTAPDTATSPVSLVEASSPTERIIEALGQRLGVTVGFMRSTDGRGVDQPGYYDQVDSIALVERSAGKANKADPRSNAKANRAVMGLFLHEWTHHLETTDPDAYRALTGLLQKLAPRQLRGATRGYLKAAGDVAQRYGEADKIAEGTAVVAEELAAYVLSGRVSLGQLAKILQPAPRSMKLRLLAALDKVLKLFRIRLGVIQRAMRSALKTQGKANRDQQLSEQMMKAVLGLRATLARQLARPGVQVDNEAAQEDTNADAATNTDTNTATNTPEPTDTNTDSGDDASSQTPEPKPSPKPKPAPAKVKKAPAQAPKAPPATTVTYSMGENRKVVEAAMDAESDIVDQFREALVTHLSLVDAGGVQNQPEYAIQGSDEKLVFHPDSWEDLRKTNPGRFGWLKGQGYRANEDAAASQREAVGARLYDKTEAFLSQSTSKSDRLLAFAQDVADGAGFFDPELVIRSWMLTRWPDTTLERRRLRPQVIRAAQLRPGSKLNILDESFTVEHDGHNAILMGPIQIPLEEDTPVPADKGTLKLGKGVKPKPVDTQGEADEADPDLPAFARKRNPQTETEAFKKWFGDSKVVDANGDPLVVYHGTDTEFNVFENRGGKVSVLFSSFDVDRQGFFFAKDEEMATEYGARVVPVYLSITNPMNALDAQSWAIARTGLVKRGWNEKYLNITDMWEMFDTFEDDDTHDGKRFVRDLKSLGYDGAIIEEPSYKDVNGNYGIAYVAFGPTQIKSATGNQGTFDADNPDIRFARKRPGQSQLTLGGEIEGRATVGDSGLLFGHDEAAPLRPSAKLPDITMPADAEKFGLSEQDMRRASVYGDDLTGGFAWGVKQALADKRQSPRTIAGLTKLEATEIRRGFNAARKGASADTKADLEEAAQRQKAVEKDQMGLFARRREPAADQGNARSTDGRKGKTGDFARRRGSDDVIEQAPPFYSALTKAIEGGPDQKLRGGQWFAWLRKQPGIKTEELEWSGLVDFLKGDKAISRDELLDFAKANEVVVEDVVLSGKNPALRELERSMEDAYEQMNESPGIMRDRAEAVLQRGLPTASPGLIGEAIAKLMDGVHRGAAYDDAVTDAVNVSTYAQQDIRAALTGSGTVRKLYEQHLDHRRAYKAIEAEFMAMVADQAEPAQFGKHTLPGGEDYRELLLTLRPQFNGATMAQKGYKAVWDEPFDEHWTIKDEAGLGIGSVSFSSADSPDAALQVFAASMGHAVNLTDEAPYRGGHFDHVPNVLVHVRFKSRTDTQGRRLLFIEEIQSDWHQAGRKKGYRLAPQTLQGEQTVQQNGEDFWRIYHPMVGYAAELLGGVRHRRDGRLFPFTADFQHKRLSFKTFEEAVEQAKAWQRPALLLLTDNHARVPDAPFKKTWHELALKRMVRWAAENGHDAVGWTTGDQQAERYDLSKQVDRIKVIDITGGMYRVEAYRQGNKLVDREAEGQGELADLVGKEMAQKAVTKIDGYKTSTIPSPKRFAEFTGTDLRVGGKGMRGFYDDILVKAAKALGKRYGASVESTTIDTSAVEPVEGQDIMETAADRLDDPTPDESTVHAMVITEKMRTSVMAAGLPRFARAWHGTPHDFDKFSTAFMGSGEGAQAYGWGLYFAGKKEVAEYYKNNISSKWLFRGETLASMPPSSRLRDLDWMGGYLSAGDSFKKAKAKLVDFLRVLMNDRDLSPEKHDPTYIHQRKEDRRAAISQRLDFAESFKDGDFVKPPNRLYDVELAPTEDEYLLWDEPIDEQSDRVKDALRAVTPESIGLKWMMQRGDGAGRYFTPDKTYFGALLEGQAKSLYDIKKQSTSSGLTLYYSLAQLLSSQLDSRKSGSLSLENAEQAASMKLHELGILGIKYLDGNSRGHGRQPKLIQGALDRARSELATHRESSHPLAENAIKHYTAEVARLEADLAKAKEIQPDYNYVIFDDADVSITAKFARKRGSQTESPAFEKWFGDSKVVDAEGNPQVVYHGSARPDRIGSTFRKNRATSGPMAFFTDDPAIGSSYAQGKADTSLEHPDDYSGWFKWNPPGSRTQVDIRQAWFQLTPQQRRDIAAKLPHVTNYTAEGDESDTYRLGGADEYGLSGADHWAYNIREQRGNVLGAAVEIWLNSGSLINSEAEFLQVLKLGGLDGVRLDDPHATYPSVYPVYLSIQNPLVTNAIEPRVIEALDKRSRRQRPAQEYGADTWDKTTRDAGEWMTVLKEDAEAGRNSTAWTSIPDWVSDTLKKLGYDGIHDTGGKMGGQEHSVWVPFDPTQIKSSTGNRGTFDPTKRDIRFARAWHGTPHDFDKFSTAFMGSGEGAQAFGWGLYFAGDKAVAEHYRDLVGRKPYMFGTEFVSARHLDPIIKAMGEEYRQAAIEVMMRAGDGEHLPELDRIYERDEKPQHLEVTRRLDYAMARNDDSPVTLVVRGQRRSSLETDDSIGLSKLERDVNFHYRKGDVNPLDTALREIAEALSNSRKNHATDEAYLAQLEKEGRDDYETEDQFKARRSRWVLNVHHGKWGIREYAAALSMGPRVEVAELPARGRLYEVDLQPTEEEYLDWDRPLEDQSETIRAALARDYARSLGVSYNMAKESVDADLQFGRTVYRQAAQDLQSDRKASSYFAELGIRGIKYLDGSSRSAGTGNYNYVIFDDADVSITAKFARRRNKAPVSQDAQHLLDQAFGLAPVTSKKPQHAQLPGATPSDPVWNQMKPMIGGPASWASTDGQTEAGGKLVKAFRADEEGRATGVRQINDYLADQLDVQIRTGAAGKAGTTSKHPVVFDPIADLIRTRSGSWQLNLHDLGHAVGKMLEQMDPGVLDRHADELKAIGLADGSLATTTRDESFAPWDPAGLRTTPDEGFAEWIRRFIWSPDTLNATELPNHVNALIEAAILKHLPRVHAALRDAHRMAAAWSARQVAAHLSVERAGTEDRPTARETAGYMSRVLDRVLFWVNAEHALGAKVLRPMYRGLRKVSSGLMRAAQKMIEGSAADVEAIAQQEYHVPGEVHRLMYGPSKHDKGAKGLRIRLPHRGTLAAVVRAIHDVDPDLAKRFIQRFNLAQLKSSGDGSGHFLYLTDFDVQDVIRAITRDGKERQRWELFEFYVQYREAINRGRDRWDVLAADGKYVSTHFDPKEANQAASALKTPGRVTERPGMSYPGLTEGVDLATLMLAIDRIGRDNPDFLVEADRINRLMDQRVLAAVVMGQFDAATAMTIVDSRESYAPLLRRFDPKNKGDQTSLATQLIGLKKIKGAEPESGVRRAFGSALPLQPLVDAIDSNLRELLTGYSRNRALKSVRALIDQVAAMDGVPPEMKREMQRMMVAVPLSIRVAATLSEDEIGKILEQVTDAVNTARAKAANTTVDQLQESEKLVAADLQFAAENGVSILRAQKPGGINLVATWDRPGSGTQTFYEIQDQLLFDYFARIAGSAKAPRAIRDWVTVWRGVNNASRRGILKTVAFIVRNGWRDVKTAVLLGPREAGARGMVPGYFIAKGLIDSMLKRKTSKDTPGGTEMQDAELLGQAISAVHAPEHRARADSIWGNFKAALGEGILVPGWAQMGLGTRFLHLPGQLISTIVKPLDMVAHVTGVSAISDWVERLSRRGAYLSVAQNELNPERAQLAYDKVSGNFIGRGGNATVNGMVATALFLNANIQTTYQLWDSLADPTKRNGMTGSAMRLAIMAATGAASAMVIFAMMDDDDKKRLKRQPRGERLRNMHIPIPGVPVPFRLPFAYGAEGAMESWGYNLAMNALLGETPEAKAMLFDGFGRTLSLDSTLGMLTPGGRLVIEYLANQALYDGRPIIPGYLSDELPEMQYSERTTEAMRKVGAFTGISPMGMEHAVDSLASRTLLDLVRLAERGTEGIDELTDLPYVGSLFARDPRGWFSRPAEQLRELSTAYEQARSMVQRLEDEGRLDDSRLQPMRDKMQELRDAYQASLNIRHVGQNIRKEMARDEPDLARIRQMEHDMTEIAEAALKKLAP